ncbi:carbohydrate binding protein [Alteromonadaceae bacterium 2753L.S.0a.02]|nr:carbohydrate binding protein [Alteromonadaceae bacterium 2753L.S.0a.02]
MFSSSYASRYATNTFRQLLVWALPAAILGCGSGNGGDIKVDYLANSSQASLPAVGDKGIGPRDPLRFDFSDMQNLDSPSGRMLYRTIVPTYVSSQGNIMPGALMIEGRTEVWQGPLIVLPNLEPGQAFTVSAWVKSQDTLDSTNFSLVLTRVVDGNDTRYVIAKSLVEPGSWQKVEGDFVAVQHGGDIIRTLHLEVEPAFTNYLLDDITVAYAEFSAELEAAALESAKSKSDGFVFNGSVEDGLVPWRHQGGFITRSSAQAHTGEHSVLITGRTAGWQGPLMEVNGLRDNEKYKVSIFTRLQDGTSPAEMKLTLKRVTKGQATFVSLGIGTANDSGWTEIAGVFTSPNISQAERVSVYLESTNPTASYYVDTLTVQKVTPD